MNVSVRKMVVIFCLLALVTPAAAQFGPGPRPPRVLGVWSPEVGAGAVYSFEGRNMPKSELQFAVVGTESFEGKPGHWLEMVMQDPRQGPMVIKTLQVEIGGEMHVKRMIMQAPGQAPMEFPVDMMQMGRQSQPQSTDFRDKAEKIGTETITTPAGTFDCEHWRSTEGGQTADVWFTAKAKPYGMVKMTSAEGSMTLVRLVTDAKTQIKGTPQKFDMQQMMRDRPE